MAIERVVLRKSMFEPDADVRFWLTIPIADRISALSEIRREFEGWTVEAEPGLPRVARVLRPT
jgi:hypothetical protein